MKDKDKPDPRPIIQVDANMHGMTMNLFIPMWCLDNQSQALTHDQLKHLTGRELDKAMRARRKELEAPPRG